MRTYDLIVLITTLAAFSVSVSGNELQKISNDELPVWRGETVRDLHNEYSNIFKHGNRNAASHLWASFLLDRASQMTQKRLEGLFEGFCAVSGSPTRPGPYSKYKMELDTVSGTKATGITVYCCWPCVCDTNDWIRVDTKTITTKEGPKEYNFLVIGNPCNDVSLIPWEAPEVRCHDGFLEGATLSDHGFIILTMFFDDDGSAKQDEWMYEDYCKRREANGFDSGMGEIFRKVAMINPIRTRDSTGALCPAAAPGREVAQEKASLAQS